MLTYQEQNTVLKEMIQLRDSALVKHLRDKCETARNKLSTTSNEIELRWMQGRVQALDELLFEIDQARAALEKPSKPVIANTRYF